MNKNVAVGKANKAEDYEKVLIDKELKQKLMIHNMTTKEKILYAALTLFSKRGYEGVTMRDIAAAVNIKGSSIYKHYKSKQQIFESIIEFMNEQYEIKMNEMHVPMGTINEVADVYCGIKKEELFEIVKKIFYYYLLDEYASKFRRILIMEQYRNSMIGDLIIKIYYENALSFQEGLFDVLIQKGYFKDKDSHTMALQFYSPIFLLINVYDQKQDMTDEAIELIRNHVYQFYDIYNQKPTQFY